MKTSSAKNKGRRLQQEVMNAILAKKGVLKPEDVRSRPMGSSGSDIMLSTLALDVTQYFIWECKNQEKAGPIYTWFEQAEINATKEHKLGKPILAVSKNHEKPLVVLKLQDFLDLL